MSSVTNAVGWLAGGFYVLVALSVVYLFFFKIVPIVFTQNGWTLWGIVRSVVVLTVVAVLLGCVAIYTADWIFSKVFDTLPTTRMAHEIDRLTGSVVRLSASTYSEPSGGAGPYYGYSNPPPSGSYPPPYSSGGTPAAPPMAGAIPGAPMTPEPTRQLKPNALDLWASGIQTKFNPTGDVTNNTEVMYPRDIPVGVRCEVGSVSSGWQSSKNEEWEITCTADNFQSQITISLNGTAARGLTGGKFYSKDSPFTVYGTGAWPEYCYEPLPTATPTSATPSDTAPESNPQIEGTPVTPAVEHKVLPGESLATIAQHYSVTVPTIVRVNQQKYPQLQSNPNVIVVGWVLAIPEK